MVWLKLREEEQPRLFVLLLDELHTAIRDEVDAVLILEANILSAVVPVVPFIRVRDDFEHIRALPKIVEASTGRPRRNPSHLLLAVRHRSEEHTSELQSLRH